MPVMAQRTASRGSWLCRARRAMPRHCPENFVPPSSFLLPPHSSPPRLPFLVALLPPPAFVPLFLSPTSSFSSLPSRPPSSLFISLCEGEYDDDFH
eukprot:3491969-Rhodomonas_salina.2